MTSRTKRWNAFGAADRCRSLLAATPLESGRFEEDWARAALNLRATAK